MDARILEPIKGGEITAPESKSHAVRIAFASALSGRAPDAVRGTSMDVRAALRCSEAVREALEGRPVQEVSSGESALTFRILLPVMGAIGAPVTVREEGSLRSRTSKVFMDLLEAHGMRIETRGEGLIRLTGKLSPGTYRLPGNVSSQFVTGLMFALPLLRGDSRIAIDGSLESEPYVRMTADVLRRSGIDIEEDKNGYFVKGSGNYSLPGGEVPEGDWSGASFWIFAGACLERGRSVTVRGLNTESLQGDRAAPDMLDRMGADIAMGVDLIIVSGGELHGIERDMSQTPDLVPAAVPAALSANGISVMRGIRRLRLKESDRPGSIADVIACLGGRTRGTENSLMIPGQRLKGGEVFSFNDHRIAMMTACMRVVSDGPVTVRNAEAVGKSYPEFWEDYAALGGKLEFTDEDTGY